LIRIALDAMSGDHGPSVTVPAALRVLSEQPNIHLTLVGDEAVLEQEVNKYTKTANAHLSIHHASQLVEMGEGIARAIRKRDSSMHVAIRLVRENQADACVSSGNTGALMAIARYMLKTLPNIDRPAIISTLPTIRGHTHMLDLGANVQSTPKHLLQFAVMGSVLTQAVDNIAEPRIGLLNIGQEEIKGNDLVKEAGRLLTNRPINYVGFVEGNDIYLGAVDVVVCDGFVGNVSLKTTEGVAQMIAYYLKQGFNQNFLTKIAGLIAKPILNNLRKKIDPRRYNGASLLGLRGIVIKSHGGADMLAFVHAIREAILEVQKNVPARISEQLTILLSEEREVG